MNVVGIGGLEVPIEGYVEVPIMLDGQILGGSFVVTEDSACRTVQSEHPILIGCNILRKLDRGLLERFPVSRLNASENESVHFRTSMEEVLPPFSVRRVMCEVNSPKLNKELLVKDALGRLNPTLSTVEGSQVLDGDSVELLLQNKSEYEVCLPSNTPVAEAQSACRKQEVHIDLEEDNVIVSVYDVITDHKSNDISTDHNVIVDDKFNSEIDPSCLEESRQRLKEKNVPSVKVGDRVLLRREAFTSRHKLQDKFDETPYVVVAHNSEEDIFQIRPVLGGSAKWVNRRRLTLDPRAVESFSDKFPTPDVEIDLIHQYYYQSSEDNDSDESSDDDVPNWLFLTRGQERSVEPRPVRRSTRSTRGINRNPFRLPSSAITGLPD